MPTHAVWKKRQAEMLFDEFVNIEKRKKGLSKNEIPIALCLQGRKVIQFVLLPAKVNTNNTVNYCNIGTCFFISIISLPLPSLSGHRTLLNV